jgi:hypothetical protein
VLLGCRCCWAAWATGLLGDRPWWLSMQSVCSCRWLASCRASLCCAGVPAEVALLLHPAGERRQGEGQSAAGSLCTLPSYLGRPDQLPPQFAATSPPPTPRPRPCPCPRRSTPAAAARCAAHRRPPPRPTPSVSWLRSSAA